MPPKRSPAAGTKLGPIQNRKPTNPAGPCRPRQHTLDSFLHLSDIPFPIAGPAADVSLVHHPLRQIPAAAASDRTRALGSSVEGSRGSPALLSPPPSSCPHRCTCGCCLLAQLQQESLLSDGGALARVSPRIPRRLHLPFSTMTRPKVPDDKRQRTAQACDSCKRRKQKVCCFNSTSPPFPPPPPLCGYFEGARPGLPRSPTLFPSDRPISGWTDRAKRRLPPSTSVPPVLADVSVTLRQTRFFFLYFHDPSSGCIPACCSLLEGNACLSSSRHAQSASCSPSCYGTQGCRG